MTTTTALVLAGSRGPGDPLALAEGVSHKALIEVGGAPMLARVVRALEAAGFARIAVAIETEAPLLALRAQGLAPATVEWLPAAEGPSASVAAGLARLGTPLLVTTADHALLRPEWVQAFLAAAPAEADVAAAVARAELVTAASPETRRTFLRFAEGAVSGCNLFHLASDRAGAVVDLWREVEALRKTPLKLLARLGPVTAARYAAGALSLREALDRLERMTGARLAAVELPFGEAAIDVDTVEDLALVRSLARP